MTKAKWRCGYVPFERHRSRLPGLPLRDAPSTTSLPRCLPDRELCWVVWPGIPSRQGRQYRRRRCSMLSGYPGRNLLGQNATRASFDYGELRCLADISPPEGFGFGRTGEESNVTGRKTSAGAGETSRGGEVA